jgi:hypothetical protein
VCISADLTMMKMNLMRMGKVDTLIELDVGLDLHGFNYDTEIEKKNEMLIET